jgi:hypothetical protein
MHVIVNQYMYVVMRIARGKVRFKRRVIVNAVMKLSHWKAMCGHEGLEASF